MGVTEIYTTLHDFLIKWLTDAGFREQYDGLEDALERHDFHDVDADDIIACLPLVAEDLPAVYQQAIYEHLNAMSEVDAESHFSVQQGGGDTGAVQEAGSAGGVGGAGGESGYQAAAAATPMETVVHYLQQVTEHNYSYIDDSGDVATNVTALGDVDFDQIVASGAGAIAADGDIDGANTGTNYGIVADDVDDAEVTTVVGDGNVTGDFDDDATVVTGDDNVLAYGSNVVDGDFDGTFVGDDVNASRAALNFGEGDVDVDNSTDNSIDDAFKIDDSGNTDNSIDDAFKIDDSGNTDNSIDDAFKIDDSGNTSEEYDLADNSDHSTTTEIEHEFDVDVDIDESIIGL